MRYIFRRVILLVMVAVLAASGSFAWADESKIGDKQYGISFSITEGGPGAFAARPLGYQGRVIIKCPAGVRFTSTPEISVIGDLKLDIVGARLNEPTNDQLTISVLRSSTGASTISFDKVQLTLDRTVPEGNITLMVGGSAIDWSGAVPGSELSIQVPVSRVTIGGVVTPAPSEQNAEAQFKIGENSFILNGAQTSMDVSPYIKDGRTFIPLFYAAQALGISNDGIIWDVDKQTATLMKGSKLVQVQIGSKTILFNGVIITLDAAPEITSGRTCLPVALLAKALGETATWDDANQTIEIK
ncbi:MAG: copper amine oxidase N-terminal domain-containing protein [Syntrophomonas sp.]